MSVVQVGFTCDYIMRALLAVSSLHLAHFRPHMREHYQSVAIVHYQAASRTALPLIPEVSDDTAQLLFLFSVLTTYYSEHPTSHPRRDGTDMTDWRSPRLAPRLRRRPPPGRLRLPGLALHPAWHPRHPPRRRRPARRPPLSSLQALHWPL